MKKSEFEPEFERLMQEGTKSGEGTTTKDLQDQTGASRQWAYAWLDKNRARFRPIGKTVYGANRWVLRGAGETNGTEAPGEIHTGARLLVKDVRWQGGLVLELELDDGTVLVADIRE